MFFSLQAGEFSKQQRSEIDADCSKHLKKVFPSAIDYASLGENLSGQYLSRKINLLYNLNVFLSLQVLRSIKKLAKRQHGFRKVSIIRLCYTSEKDCIPYIQFKRCIGTKRH